MVSNRPSVKEKLFCSGDADLLPTLEELHRALVFLRRGERGERAQIPTLSRLRVSLAGIKAVLSRFHLSNHEK